MLYTYSTVWQCEIGIRPKDKMVEIFNLRLNSRNKARNELQTKHPFGESSMDYMILFLVHRDQGNHSAALYPVGGGAWCHCVLFIHPEGYMMTVIAALHFSHLLGRRFFFLMVQPTKSVCVVYSAACSTLQQIVCVSGYRSIGHTECTMSVCVCVCEI